MRTLKSLILVAIGTSLFVSVGYRIDAQAPQAGTEDYYEECQSEGCDGEELSEMYSLYSEECISEGCSVEENRETAGRSSSINAMLNAFQARGWTVSGCDYIGSCTPTPGNNATSGDSYFGPISCDQDQIDMFWEDYDFDKGDWDDGFGYWDACNIDLPLARTFNALSLLSLYGTSMPSGSSNWLPWFYSYSSNEIDELDGRCGSGDPNGCTFATNYQGIDDYTELYWPFFYRLDVVSRAGTIVHESRHAGGYGHDCTSCANGGSCDSDWDYSGANYLAVMYLWWLRAEGGSEVTTAMKNQAQTRANAQLPVRFCSGNPTREEVFGADVSSPTLPFSVP